MRALVEDLVLGLDMATVLACGIPGRMYVFISNHTTKSLKSMPCVFVGFRISMPTERWASPPPETHAIPFLDSSMLQRDVITVKHGSPQRRHRLNDAEADRQTSCL